MTHTVDTEAQQAVSALRHGQQAGEAVSMATGREWKSEKWWIALPIATRTIDRYPLGLRGQGAGTSPGAVHTRAWAGVRGGNRPPRRQADPGGPSLPRGAPKGRHNCHFQPAAGESDSESGSRLRFLQKRPRGAISGDSVSVSFGCCGPGEIATAVSRTRTLIQNSSCALVFPR